MRVSPKQINVARQLLDMLYKPAELSTELGIDKQTIYEWIKQGLPNKKDDKGRLWINGTKAGQWILVQGIKHKGRKVKRPDTLVYCVKCRTHTEYKNSKLEYLASNRIILKAVCVVCGTQVRQFRKGVK